MSLPKFNSQFPSQVKDKDSKDRSWEDARYVYKLSELGKQALRDRLYKPKQKQIGSIRASFIGDNIHKEMPEIYNTVEDKQIVDVFTPVQESPVQDFLWKDFKTSHFRDVQYKGRESAGSEDMYDKKGERHIVQKVINQRIVPIRVTKMVM